MNSIDATLVDKVLMKTHLDLQKRFPDIPCDAWRPFSAARRYERMSSTSLQVLDEVGNDTGRLVTWEFPLRIDNSILKIL